MKTRLRYFSAIALAAVCTWAAVGNTASVAAKSIVLARNAVGVAFGGCDPQAVRHEQINAAAIIDMRMVGAIVWPEARAA